VGDSAATVVAGIMASAPNTTADEMMFRMGSLRPSNSLVHAIGEVVGEIRIITH
jgi:hypothetical protein